MNSDIQILIRAAYKVLGTPEEEMGKGSPCDYILSCFLYFPLTFLEKIWYTNTKQRVVCSMERKSCCEIHVFST